MLNYNFKILILIILFCVGVLSYSSSALAGTLSCTTRTANCNTGEISVLRMWATANSHVELPSQSNYQNIVCCSGVIGLTTDCSGIYDTILKLSSATNAHAEQNTQSNYATSTCLSVPTGGTVSVGYQANTCSGYDTTIASMSTTTNAHIGDVSGYTTKICASAESAIQTLSFNISDNTIGFGNLTTANARYATGDMFGSNNETEAHVLTASTNASSGYSIMINGTSLYNSYRTITPIGCANASSTPAAEQFGLRATVSSGTGVISSPYSASGFAFCTNSFPGILATGTGDSATSTYSIRYITNISNITPAGDYNTILSYVITAQF